MVKLIRHIRNSLPTKISLSMFLAALLIFTLLSAVLSVQSRNHFHSVAMDNSSEALSTAVARAERYLRSVETVTNITARITEDNFVPDSLLAFSRRIVQLNSFVSGCSISARPEMFAKYGRFFSAYTVRKEDGIVTVVEDGYDYSDYPWYSKAAQSGKAGWVDPFVDDNEGGLSASHVIASYSRPLYDDKNRLLGVISTDLSLPELSDALSSVKPYPHSYFMLLGPDGRYYVHPDSSKIIHQTIFDLTDSRYSPDKMALGYQMIRGQTGRMHANLAGVHSLICYQPISGTDWSAALVSSERDVLHGFRRLEISIGLIFLIALLILFIICSRTVARAFTPLKLLEEQTRLLSEGDYSAVIPHSNQISNIGYLQNSFADMQETLSRSVRELNIAIEVVEKHNEELRKANARLEEAIRRRSSFVSDLTHQIRTPLNLIMGFSQLIRDAGGDLSPHELQRLLHVMDYNAMTLRRMSLMLYDSSDRGYHDEMVSLQYEHVSCNEVARECIGYTHRYFPDVTVQFQTSLEDSFTIVSDHLYLMRSIREILFNSAKYSDGKNVSLRVSSSKTRVRFVFEDTGSGIPPENQEHMFTPFYKKNNLSEGLGMGLPLTRRHVILLGGSLELDRDYRLGCRYYMEFPIDNPSHPSS